MIRRRRARRVALHPPRSRVQASQWPQAARL